MTGTYDPELDLVYWGTGNPSPWNPRARAGDNLWTNAIVAIRPKTGERVWVYQTTPADPFDYDGVHTPVIATIKVGGQAAQGRDAGQPRRLPLCARRQGRQAAGGQRLRQGQLGRRRRHDDRAPEVNQVYHDALAGKNVEVWPSVSGVTNWQHMSFSPQTGLLYINTLHIGMTYEAPEPPKLDARQAVRNAERVKRTVVLDDPNVRGYLKAVDPMTGKSKWETPYKSPNYSSTLVTASNLVFTGVMTGEFQALDADTGKVLWSFQTPSGIVGQPVTWERNGKQYVTVMSGIGGVYALRSGDPNLVNVPAGASLWTFALFDK